MLKQVQTRGLGIPALAALLLAICAVVAGCGSGSTAANGEGGTAAGGDTLTIAAPNDVTSLDPAYVIDNQTHELLTNVYEVGIGLGPEDTKVGKVLSSKAPEPAAFEKWTRSKDGLEYTFQVRKGMTFHNGDPLTAEDVAYSYNRLLATEGGKFTVENIIKDTKPVEAHGKYEVVMHTDEPSALATQMLFADTYSILDKSEVEKHATKEDPWAEKWLSQNIAGGGSGAYVLKEHVKGQELVLEGFKDFWKGPPAYKKIVVKIVPSASERLSLLQAGAVDVAEELTPQQVASVKGTSGISVTEGPTFRQTAIPLNLKNPSLKDEGLRQAMSYAVNYDEIIESVYEGAAVRSVGPIPTGAPYALKGKPAYEYDPEKAKQLVEESGYDGATINLLYNSEEAVNEEVAVRVQGQMKAVGISVELEPQSNTVYEEKISKKDFDMAVDSVLGWIPDPDYIMSLFYECGSFFNYGNYCNKNVDQAIAKGWGIFDFNERYALFEAAQKEMVQEAPWIWIAQANYQWVAKDSVKGFITPQNLIPIYDRLHPGS